VIERWYASKVDWWLAIVLALAPAACLLGGFASMRAGEGVVIAFGGCAVMAAVYLGLVFPMRYGMDERTLVVRYGLVRTRIALTDIVEVRPTRNPLSSPALSLDRLRIRFGEGFTRAIMISPRERDAFMTELCRRTGLRRDGDGWVR
jgi:hypothetical protein